MNVIRKLQEERTEWEAEKEQNQEDKAWYESELARLNAENAKLISSTPSAAAGAAAPVELSAPVQDHHVQQLKLMETIDLLRTDLQSERERREQLERLLPTLAQGAGAAGAAGSGDRLGMTGISQLDMTLAAAMRPMPAAEEFTNLEDENLKLREELNASKEKVIELKRAAAKRSSDWRSELQTITEELSTKHALDGEAVTLRQDRSRLQEELVQTRQLLGQRESLAKAENERLKEELLRLQEKCREGVDHRTQAEDLDRLSQTMGQRVIELEQELSSKVGEQSRLLTLFLKHSEQPLETMRLHCKRLLASSSDGEVPYSFEPDPSDIQQSLVNIIDMLRWAQDVTEGYEDARQQRRAGYAR